MEQRTERFEGADRPATIHRSEPTDRSASADPFTSAAATYDGTFSALPEVKELRRRIYSMVEGRWRPGGKILELGCGTGEDALRLAQRGYRVTATDPSAAMLAQAMTKAERSGEHIRFVQTGAEELGMFARESFDGILSNFGALNCVEDLQPVLEASAALLNEGGIAAICLMSSLSIWELTAFLMRGDFRSAFRRRARSRMHSGAGISVKVGDGVVPTWYHSTGKVLQMARRNFRVLKVAGLNFLSPPPGSRDFITAHPRLSRFLGRLEERVESAPLLSRLGDHVVILLEKQSGART